MEHEYLFVFRTRNHAVHVKSKLRDQGYTMELCPTPRKLAKSCSYSAMLSCKALEVKEVRDRISGLNVTLAGVYKVTRTGSGRAYKKIHSFSAVK